MFRFSRNRGRGFWRTHAASGPPVHFTANLVEKRPAKHLATAIDATKFAANRFGTTIALTGGSTRTAVTFTATRQTISPLENAMLGWALTFLIIALIAGVLGFGVVAGTAASIAKILFVVFLVLFIIGLVMGRRGPAV